MTRGVRTDLESEPSPLSRDAEEYLSYLSVEKGRAASSLSAYRRDLRAYEQFLAGRQMAVADVGSAEIEEYLQALKDLGRAPSTRARALAAIRGLHGFAREERGVVDDPTGDVESPRVPQGLPKPLSETEVTRLLAAIVGDSAVARRDRSMLEMLYATGARISELVGLSVGDVDREADLVRLFGKGSKERIVPMGSYAADALGAWLAEGGRPSLRRTRPARREDADALYLSRRGARMSRQAAWTVVRSHAVAAGLAKKASPHVLRHSCATHMLDHGADIRVVQELLGHASITTTQLYTKVSQEHLRRAYLAAHPRALVARRAHPAGADVGRPPAG